MEYMYKVQVDSFKISGFDSPASG